MPDQTIKCPNCGTAIELTEALTGQIERDIRLKYQAAAQVKEKEVTAKLDEIGRRAKVLEQEKAGIDEQVSARVRAEKLKIAEERKVLEGQRLAIEEQVAEVLRSERKGIVEIERKKALAEQAEEKRALQDELAEKAGKLVEANKKELELRKQQRELQEAKEVFELESVRKLDEERKKIAEEASRKAVEEQQLKMREKDDQLAAMKKQIDELKRKSEVGSQEAQGEALEGAFRDVLQQTFPYDEVEDVKKGARGADVLQTVISNGKACGVILWESKNTKDFQKSWIPKLKKDQQDAKADIAVIMSMVLPKEIGSFDHSEDIWITDYKSSIALATALRQILISVAREKLRSTHQESMKDVVYDYVTGNEFNMRVRQIATAYIEMQKDIETEKRSMNRIWSKREKQISLVLENLSGMRGEVEAIVGGQKTLPEIEPLTLEGIVQDDETDEEGKLTDR